LGRATFAALHVSMNPPDARVKEGTAQIGISQIITYQIR
jgi:hypothetical protein